MTVANPTRGRTCADARPGIHRPPGQTTGHPRVSDTFARDGSPSPRARSVGLYLLLRDDSVVAQEEMARDPRMSATTVRCAPGDPAAAGYPRHRTVRRGHRVVGTEYLCHDHPLSDEEWTEASGRTSMPRRRPI